MRSESPRQLPATWLARRALVAVTIICSLSKPASAVTTARKAFYLPLTRRDGVSRARGLLRNASLPLHGAVRDYGCASAFGTAPTPLCHLAVPNQSHQLQRSAVKSHVRPRRGTSLVLSRAGVQRKAQAPGRLENSVVCLLLTNDRSAVAGCYIRSQLCLALPQVLLRQHPAGVAAEAVRGHSGHGVDDHLCPVHLVRRSLRHPPQRHARSHSSCLCMLVSEAAYAAMCAVCTLQSCVKTSRTHDTELGLPDDLFPA